MKKKKKVLTGVCPACTKESEGVCAVCGEWSDPSRSVMVPCSIIPGFEDAPEGYKVGWCLSCVEEYFEDIAVQFEETKKKVNLP